MSKALIPIAVVIIAGLFGLVEIVLPQILGDFEIADVDFQSNTLDFKVINNSSDTVFITGVLFKVNEVEEFEYCLYSLVSSEYDYSFDFIGLEKKGDVGECSVSHMVRPGEVSRFRVFLENSQSCGRWLLGVSLITSEGIIPWGQIEVVWY